MKNKLIKNKQVLIIILLTVVVVGIFLWYESQKNTERYLIAYDVTTSKEFMNPSDTEERTPNTLKEWQTINPDIELLLYLNDRTIPVVQSKDNEDYVRRNVYDKGDSMGSVFIDYVSSTDADNLILQGHSSHRNNYMFTPFKNIKYVKQNQIITIDFGEETKAYQVVSYYCVDWETETDFTLYSNEFRNTEELQSFIEYSINKSEHAFDIDIEVVKEKQILTLITCDVTEENSRYILVALET